ncbi:type II toxin-antitoxin system HicA family toxin [Methanothrix sp.]|uniref:type II toxin-antitoxin system HicA family toxin n=1 Tax=Methanothrix sp. TaxID=90426 RepID=UPI002CD4A71F|nr:type II toxin-antitoxin system HicA family toxin [Methanothrix soehngenii]
MHQRSRYPLSNKLLPVPRRELIRRLGKLGFVGPFPGAGHEYMSRGLLEVRIPNPHGSDISTALLQKILKRAGISREEWFDTD